MNQRSQDLLALQRQSERIRALLPRHYFEPSDDEADEDDDISASPHIQFPMPDDDPQSLPMPDDPQQHELTSDADTNALVDFNDVPHIPNLHTPLYFVDTIFNDPAVVF